MLRASWRLDSWTVGEFVRSDLICLVWLVWLALLDLVCLIRSAWFGLSALVCVGGFGLLGSISTLWYARFIYSDMLCLAC